MEELSDATGVMEVDRTYSYGLDLIAQDRFDIGSSAWDATFYLYDGHGNVRALADDAGTITDTYDYDAFGTLIEQLVLDVSASGLVPVTTDNRDLITENNYLYCGEQFDPDLGLYFLRARYMDTERGRFWSMDSFEGWIYDPIALHKYLYAGSNPVSYKDPCGNFTLTELQSSMLIGAIVNSISTVATPGFLQKPLSEQLLDIGISASIGAASGAAGVGIAKSYFAVTKPMWKAMAAGGTASFVNQLATEVFNFIIKDEKLTIGLVCGASIRTFQATFAGVVTGGLMVKIMTPSPGSSRFFPGGYEAPIPLGWFEVPASSVVGGIAKGSSGGVLTNIILNWMALDRRWCK